MCSDVLTFAVLWVLCVLHLTESLYRHTIVIVGTKEAHNYKQTQNIYKDT